jgi:hypothetical protein
MHCSTIWISRVFPAIPATLQGDLMAADADTAPQTVVET